MEFPEIEKIEGTLGTLGAFEVPQNNKVLKEVMQKYGLTSADFWTTKEGVQIIRHRGCLKVALKDKIKLRPWRYEIHHTGRDGYIEIIYRDWLRGIFEIGEVNPRNCVFEYPYLIALKRVQDRVILKLSGLAAKGIYSEVEAEEFKENPAIVAEDDLEGLFPETPYQKPKNKEEKNENLAIYLEAIGRLQVGHEILVQEYIKVEFKKTSIDMLDELQARKVVQLLSGKE